MAEPNARGATRPPSNRSGVTLLWGDDEFLLRDAAHARLRAAGADATEVDARAWQGGEMFDLATPSLWGERRALLVLGAQNMPEHGVRELEAYVSGSSPDAILVVTAVARTNKPPKWADAVQAAGGVVAQVALRKQDLPRWLAERATAQGLRMTPQAGSALIATLGEDPATLHQAVIQLASAFGDASVGPAEVHAQFQGVGEQRVWDLCDRAFAGRLGDALVALRSMLEDREDGLVILGGIASRVRDLIRVRALPDRLPSAEAARRAGLRFDWQLRRYREQAGRFSLAELRTLHERIVEADRALKGGVPGAVLLPTLVAAMAGQPEAALEVEIRSSR
jgi:DNA polymerase-3 subunit delta